MKREKPETVLLAEINACLQEPISAEEKRIFLLAKRYLEKKKYLSAIVSSLQNALTPLAIREELSDSGKKIYRLLLDPKFPGKRRFGVGIMSLFGG